jgi:hypothetical protein
VFNRAGPLYALLLSGSLTGLSFATLLVLQAVQTRRDAPREDRHQLLNLHQFCLRADTGVCGE